MLTQLFSIADRFRSPVGRRRHFYWSLCAEERNQRTVTTSSKFKVRRFWRGAMRPPAPVRSGAARGWVRRTAVSMPSRRSRDQPRQAAAVLMTTRR